MGREATVFYIDKTLDTLTYMDVGKAIARPNENYRISYTIEFYPEEGKYHYTGHRNCKIIRSPKEIKENGNICPVCNRRLTEGVMYRVQSLAGQAEFKIYNSEFDENGVNWIKDPKNIHPPFVKLVPLNEIIAESMEATVLSEKVKIKFDEMCLLFGSELNILLKTPVLEIEKKFGGKIAEGIAKVRRGDIFIDPGYDGEYGKVKIWSEEVTSNVQSVNPEAQLGLKF